MKKKYLMFDIDGTLINSGGAGKKALILAFKKILGDGSFAQDYAFAGKTDIQIIEDIAMLAGVEKNGLEEKVKSIKQSYVNNLKITLQETETYRVYSYVNEVLETFYENNNFELALLTGNIYEGAKLKLEHGGLWEYFRWGAYGDISNNRIHLAEEAYTIISKKKNLKVGILFF